MCWRGEGKKTQLFAYNDLFINSPSCLPRSLLSSQFSSPPDWPTCLSSPEHFKLNLTTLPPPPLPAASFLSIFLPSFNSDGSSSLLQIRYSGDNWLPPPLLLLPNALVYAFVSEREGGEKREGWREYRRSAVVLNAAAALINVWMESHIITGRAGDMDSKSKP